MSAPSVYQYLQLVVVYIVHLAGGRVTIWISNVSTICISISTAGSTIILKLWVEKIDTKGFSAVLVSTGTPESCNKMLTESTIGIYIKFKMAAKTH